MINNSMCGQKEKRQKNEKSKQKKAGGGEGISLIDKFFYSSPLFLLVQFCTNVTAENYIKSPL